MDILIWVFFIIEAILGVASCVGIIGIMFITLGGKIMNKVRFGKSLYD